MTEHVGQALLVERIARQVKTREAGEAGELGGEGVVQHVFAQPVVLQIQLPQTRQPAQCPGYLRHVRGPTRPWMTGITTSKYIAVTTLATDPRAVPVPAQFRIPEPAKFRIPVPAQHRIRVPACSRMEAETTQICNTSNERRNSFTPREQFTSKATSAVTGCISRTTYERAVPYP